MGCYWHPLDSHGITLEDTNFIGLVNVLKARNPGVRMALSCKTGMRAKSAARLIQKDNGHQPLIVSGGIGAWKKAGLPVETV